MKRWKRLSPSLARRWCAGRQAEVFGREMMGERENESLHDLLPTRPVSHILRPAEARAWQEGFAFLETAQKEARRTQEAAKQAYAREYAQGYEDGKAAGEAEAARLVSETVVKVDRYLEGIEKDVVSLALDIVKR